MKANSNFREQVGQVTSWFKEWSECEQTVALYSLLKKLTPAQARFLEQVLQQSLADCAEVKQLQKKANDAAFVSALCIEEKGKVILQLLQLLPLLQAGNDSAKLEYLKLIPDVLSHTIENGVNIEESRQLLSYSLIHPAINHEERSKFRMWLGYLEERFTYNISHHAPRPSLALHDSISSGGAGQNSATNFAPSLICASSHSQEGLNSLLGTAAASPSLSSSLNNGWHSHTQFSGLDGGAVSGNGGLGDGDAGVGVGLNGHQLLRAAHSHVGTFSMHHTQHLGSHMTLCATSSAPPQFESMAAPIPQGTCNQPAMPPNMHTPLRRTTSVLHQNTALPLRVQNPEKTVTDWLKMHSGTPSGAACASGIPGRDRCSPSLSTEHAPLSPQSSVTSSGSGGSDTQHDDGPQTMRDSFLEDGSGMREVPVWLKTLRLHKYSYLFRQMTYEDMLNITEEWLEAQKITKGARHKIVLCITKLHERQQTLRQFEKHIMEGGSISEVLVEMKLMLNTPIKAYCPPPDSSPLSPCPTDTDVAEGNLPGQFVRLMGKVCTQLLTARAADDDCLQIYFQLIDKCVQHEAFSYKQKTLLSTWKQQAQKIWQPPLHRFNRTQKGWGNTFPLHPVAARASSASRIRLAPPSPQQWSFGSRRSVVGSNLHTPLQRNSSLNTAILNKPGLMEQVKQPVTRTQSAPMRSTQLSLMQSLQPTAVDAMTANDTEINARLDSLCLSMTEHALGGDGCEKGSTF